MPASVEFMAKNIDKAVKKACAKLKITEDKIKYDVLSFGSTGIFGLAGSKKAKIRVKLEEEPKKASSEIRLTLEEELKKPSSEISSKPEGEYLNSEKSADSEGLDGIDERKTLSSAKHLSKDDSLILGRDILQRIIDSLTTDATIEVEEDPERVLFSVIGGNSAILIGKRGQTLEAIQSLVEKAVNKNNIDRIRLQIDIAGYLETRQNNLEQLANRLSEKSKRIGKPISLGQMSAADRRIIHMTLKEDPDVRTQSRGDGYLKKLVIFPRKSRKQNEH